MAFTNFVPVLETIVRDQRQQSPMPGRPCISCTFSFLVRYTYDKTDDRSTSFPSRLSLSLLTLLSLFYYYYGRRPIPTLLFYYYYYYYYELLNIIINIIVYKILNVLSCNIIPPLLITFRRYFKEHPVDICCYTPEERTTRITQTRHTRIRDVTYTITVTRTEEHMRNSTP